MTSLRASRTKARHTKTVIIALIAMIGLSLSGGLVAAEHSQDRDELERHCPDHNGHPNKVDDPEANSTHNVTVNNVTVWLSFSEDLRSVEFFADENLTMPISVKFCIKAADRSGGKETGIEGHVSWENPGGNIPEISYVIVYKIIDDEPHEPCDGPEWIMAVQTNLRVNVTWAAYENATDENLTGYQLYRAIGDGPFEPLTQTDANTTMYVDLDVEENVTYHYEVTAKVEGKDRSETEVCDQATVTVAEKPEEPVCIGPQWITGSAHANPPMNQLEWDSFPNATGYNLYRAAEGGAFSLLSQTDGNTTSFSDFDVEVGTTYQYRVTALLGEEETDHCDEVEITAIPVFATLLAGALAGVLAIGAYATIRRKE